MPFDENIISFLSRLSFPIKLPEGIELMNPFLAEGTMNACRQFYEKFYSDESTRWMIIGINPGRFGAGITGVPFTDPIRLENNCGIPNNWPKKQELSSVFIYQVIDAFGGPEEFYKNFYITAVSPLGFTQDGTNLNYYDDKKLLKDVRPFVVDSMEKQLDFGIHRNAAFCLGDGKNFKYINQLNKEKNWFKNIIPLAHPRFIMQYRLKRKDEYIRSYLDSFQSAISSKK